MLSLSVVAHGRQVWVRCRDEVPQSLANGAISGLVQVQPVAQRNPLPRS
jgi:hypothetical protein